MKALVYTAPESLEIRDVADPSPAEGDVVLTVNHCGICGSDMHAYLGHDERRPAPLILGHEAAGVATNGKRYTVNPLVTCGTCDWCREGRDNLCPNRQIISMMPREGAFAEQLAMPAGNLIEIPDGVPTEKAALAEPIACGWHAVRLAREASKRPIEDSVCLAIGGGAIPGRCPNYNPALGPFAACNNTGPNSLDQAATTALGRTVSLQYRFRFSE